jgi:hypothetical protein
MKRIHSVASGSSTRASATEDSSSVVDLSKSDEQISLETLKNKVESLFEMVFHQGAWNVQCKCCGWLVSAGSCPYSKKKVHIWGKEIKTIRAAPCTNSLKHEKFQEIKALLGTLSIDSDREAKKSKSEAQAKANGSTMFNHFLSADDSKAVDAEQAILRFVVSNGIATSVVETFEFLNMLHKVRQAGSSFALPKRRDLSIVNNVQGRVLQKGLVRPCVRACKFAKSTF